MSRKSSTCLGRYSSDRNTAKHWGKCHECRTSMLAIRYLFFSRFLPWRKWRKNLPFSPSISQFALPILAILFLLFFTIYYFSPKNRWRIWPSKSSLIINLHYYTALFIIFASSTLLFFSFEILVFAPMFRPKDNGQSQNTSKCD